MSIGPSYSRILLGSAQIRKSAHGAVAALIALALVCALPSAQADAQSSPRRIAIVLDRRYTETAANVGAFALAIAQLPPTLVQSRPGETYEQLAVRKFAIGNSKPAYFEEIKRQLREMNGVTDLAVAAPDTVLIPMAARWSPPRGYDSTNKSLGYRRDTEKNAKPLVAEARLLESSRTRHAAGALSDSWLEAQEVNRGAYSAVVYVDVTDTSEVRHLLASGQAFLTDDPMDVVTDDVASGLVDSGSTTFALTEAESLAIATSLRATKLGRVSVPLIVLDTEWPTRTEAELTSKWLYHAINRVRRRVSVDTLPHRALPASVTDRPDSHAAAIADALRPFRLLDTEQRIVVRYLPLIAGPGADSLFVDLLTTYFRLRAAELAQGINAEDLGKEARAVVDRMQKAPGGGNAAAIKGNRSILDALLFVLDRNAISTRIPYLVNTSWVSTRDMSSEPPAVSPRRGFIVAAPGNYGENVLESSRDLSRLSQSGNFILSVENRDDRNTRLCNSNYFPPEVNALKDGRIVAFRGGRRATNPFPCGTSFSAPRVAWMIAAGFSADGTLSDVKWRTWSDVVLNRIAAASVVPAGGGTRQFKANLFLQP